MLDHGIIRFYIESNPEGKRIIRNSKKTGWDSYTRYLGVMGVFCLKDLCGTSTERRRQQHPATSPRMDKSEEGELETVKEVYSEASVRNHPDR